MDYRKVGWIAAILFVCVLIAQALYVSTRPELTDVEKQAAAKAAESAVDSTGLTLYILSVSLLGIVVYLLPWIVAIARKHLNSISILMLTVFFGWTFLGWVIALVWACSNNVTESKRRT